MQEKPLKKPLMSFDGAMKEVVVSTRSGHIRGRNVDGVLGFLGVPYAAPPFGANRFRSPQPPVSWTGVRDALCAGPGAPQPQWDNDPFNGYYNPAGQGEDCLVLDVWTPEIGAAMLPVMVWIHGGGFLTGAGSVPAHDGRTFARDGIVHVSINYRLGVEGFLYLGKDTDNLGLRDQVAALQWVQDNIAGFGGDPSQVTVFGQSAGALSVFDLLAMPSARGLFKRAIAQSGTPSAAVTTDDALEVTEELAKRLGVDATVEAFRAFPVDQSVQHSLMMAIDWGNFSRWGSRTFLVSPWRAVYGTPSLPELPLDVAAASDVSLLAGTTRNEATAFLEPMGLMENVDQVLSDQILALLGISPKVAQAYVHSRGIDNPRDLVEAAWTDWAFRIPTIRAMERRTAPSYLYEFRWQSPLFPPGVGSAHALDIPFMRNDLTTMKKVGPAGELMVLDAPQELAESMHRAWVLYAKTGDPGWPAYDKETRKTMLFNHFSEVQLDPANPERTAWENDWNLNEEKQIP